MISPTKDISNNKRIARNTTFLFIRMIVTMAISLYTSRVVLNTLGVNDYGIYNVVGGVVAMFSFLNSTMSSATSRFLTFELGTGDVEKLKKTFSSAFWVHVIIALILCVLCETIGLWFLNHKMVIPEERVFAANIVFQLSVISTVITITQVPYNAAIIAHEDMDIYAYVEMLNVFFKLMILFIVVKVSYDKLIVYGIMILLISCIVMMIYHLYGATHYKECRVRPHFDKDIIKPMIAYSSWDLYGQMSVTARTQGVSMLLNVFFGPVMNAASGISTSVQSALMSFSNNIFTASRPQIIKYYAQGQYENMERLINNTSKACFLLISLIILPIMMEIDYILTIWLKTVPEMTSSFCTLTLFFNIASALTLPLAAGLSATGKIKAANFINGSVYILVIPITYFLFKVGAPAWVPFLINVVAINIGMFVYLVQLNSYVSQYKILSFIIVLVKCYFIFVMAYFPCLLLKQHFNEGMLRLFLVTVLSSSILIVFGWLVLLSREQKNLISSKIKDYYHSKKFRKQ